jgi:S1-C subfamily serine protease
MIRGNDDPIYAAYAMASRVATKTHYRIQISGRAARDHHLLEDVMWVLIGKDEKGFEIQQGTAFSLGGVGIVSSRHLFDNRMSSWWIVRAIPPLHRFEVTSWRFDKDLDLTVLDTEAPFFGVLHPSTSDVKAGDPVRVAGYPAWNTSGDRIWVATSRVAQLKTVGGISYIVTDAFIRGGTSGGPILSEDGCALGVIVYDMKNPSTPAAGINIKHLRDLRDTSVRRP